MTSRYPPPIVDYPRIPYDEDWLDNLPVRYVDGQRGFDRRLADELARIGVRCYTIEDLANGPRSIPPAIPIYVDWLKHIDQKIPGPETKHKSIIRAGLITVLNDRATKGNHEIIDLLVSQLSLDPPLPEFKQAWVGQAIAAACGPKEFDLLVELINRFSPGPVTYPLIEHLGRFKRQEAIDVLVRQLDHPEVRSYAIQALTRMRAEGVRDAVAGYLDDPNTNVRKHAKKALEKLP